MGYQNIKEKEEGGFCKDIHLATMDGILALAVINYGLEIPQPPEVTESTGFSVLYQSDLNLSLDVRRGQSITTAGIAIRAALDSMGWTGKDVQRLAVGSSVLIDNYHLPQIMEEGGISHLKPDSQVELTAMACNSGVRAMQKELCRDEQVKTLYITYDGLTDRAVTKDSADPLSWSVFSNCVAAMATEPGALKHVYGSELILRPDTRGALAAKTVVPVENKSGMPTGQLIKGSNWECVTLPYPKDPTKILDMNGLGTYGLFARLLQKSLNDFKDELDKHGVRVDKVLSHMPAKKTLEGILGRIPWLKLDWLDVKGNSSGSTIYKSMAMQIDQIYPGDNVMFVGYGGGACATFEVAEVGK